MTWQSLAVVVTSPNISSPRNQNKMKAFSRFSHDHLKY